MNVQKIVAPRPCVSFGSRSQARTAAFRTSFRFKPATAQTSMKSPRMRKRWASEPTALIKSFEADYIYSLNMRSRGGELPQSSKFCDEAFERPATPAIRVIGQFAERSQKATERFNPIFLTPGSHSLHRDVPRAVRARAGKNNLVAHCHLVLNVTLLRPEAY